MHIVVTGSRWRELLWCASVWASRCACRHLFPKRVPLEKGQRFRRPLHNGGREPPHDKSHGSICGVGWLSTSFRINDLEMVAQI